MPRDSCESCQRLARENEELHKENTALKNWKPSFVTETQLRETCDRLYGRLADTIRSETDLKARAEELEQMLRDERNMAESLDRQRERAEAKVPDDIRSKGWKVAVHNDYTLDGHDCTFWLFTKGSVCVKGEGSTDEEALNEVRAALADEEPTRRACTLCNGEGGHYDHIRDFNTCPRCEGSKEEPDDAEA